MYQIAGDQGREPDLAGVLDNSPSEKPKDSSSALELLVRIVFGSLLALAAVAAVFLGGIFFASFVAIGAVSAVREWHRMIECQRFGWELVLTAATIVGAIGLLIVKPNEAWPWLLIAAAAVANALLAIVRKAPPVWQGFGVVYVGVTALSLVAIRNNAPNGLWVMLGLFIVVWAADTGALLAGKLVGGPKLVPALSPNKTWAGFIGGIALAAAAEAIYIAWFGGNVVFAAVYGVCLAVVACGGDLFESWTKRVFNRKNSGSLIPGHGGVLDRVDSTLFVAPVSAILVLMLGIDTLFGAHP
jgi:phosphatidate cytidylyltransferase